MRKTIRLATILIASFLLITMVPSFLATSAMLVTKIWSVFELSVLIILLSFFILPMLAWRHPNSKSDTGFLYLTIFIITALRMLMLWSATDYEQTGDTKYYLDTVITLTTSGLNEDTILQLSRIYYDDYLWIGRAFPLFYPLALISPENTLWLGRMTNLLLGALTLFPLYHAARLISGRRTARMTVAIFATIPIQSWLHLDYTHQIQGAFCMVTLIWSLLVFAKGHKEKRIFPFHIALITLMLIWLHLQSGIDLFAMVLITGLTILIGVARYSRQAFRPFILPIVCMILPILLFIPFKHSFDEWHHSIKSQRMSSHPISFTARGWSLRTLGEYDGLYEQVDRESPYSKKHETMLRLIRTAIQEDPVATLGYLPIIKTTKYFLVGYASGIGDKLHDANHHRAAVFFDQSRYLFAPLFLGLVILGCLIELSRASIQPSRTWFMAIPAVFVGIYLIAGETSPRYSFHIQPILAWLAAVGLLSSARVLKKKSHLKKSLIRLGWSLPVIALSWMFAAVSAWTLSPVLLGDHGFVDVSKNLSSVKSGRSPLHVVRGAGDRWNERRVIQLSSSGQQEAVRQLELPEHSAGHYSFFIWPTSVNPESTLVIDWGPTQQHLTQLTDIRRPQYVEGPTGSFTEVTFRYLSEKPSTVDVGYLGFWPATTVEP